MNHAWTVEESVYGGAGEHRIGEDRAPLLDVAVRREQQRRRVPAAVEQVEDLFRDFGLHRDDAPVVEDPEARGEDLLEEQIERVAGMSMSDLL